MQMYLLFRCNVSIYVGFPLCKKQTRLPRTVLEKKPIIWKIMQLYLSFKCKHICIPLCKNPTRFPRTVLEKKPRKIPLFCTNMIFVQV